MNQERSSDRTRDHGRARRAVATAFFVSGFLTVLWVTRLPSLRLRLQLTDGDVGIALFCSAFGALLSVSAVSRLRRQPSTKALIRIAIPAMAVASILVATAPDLLTMAVGTGVLGVTLGLTDVAMNTQAATLEVASGRKLMATMHACWSLGSAAAAAWGALSAYLHLSPGVAAIAGATAATLASAVTGPHLRPHVVESAGARPARARLGGRLIAVGLIMFVAFLTEGVITGWATLYFHEEFHLVASAAAAGYLAFEACMVVGRLTGDRLRVRVADRRVSLFGAVMVTVALVVAALASRAWVAVLALSLSALGQCNLVPISFAAANLLLPARPEAAAARVATFGYLGSLLGPVSFGFLSASVGMRAGFVGLAALSGCMAVLIGTALHPATSSSAEAYP